MAKKINPLQKKNPTYYDRVFEVTRQIPYGRISTYGAIADYLALGSARMVGWALNKSFYDAQVPAHRVVNRKGELSGRVHFPTPTMMEEMLEQEGVAVKDYKVLDFKELLWLPADHLTPINPTEQ